MGTVKYTGPVASFHCPTNAGIRSLKVHFSPKQEGSGDPSPENVREIVGWDGVEAYNYMKIDTNTATIPNEYKKVEYLTATGTQYVATNYVPHIGDKINTQMQMTNISGSYQTIFSAGTGDYQLIILLSINSSNQTTVYFKYFQSGNAASYGITTYKKYNIFVRSDGTIFMDGLNMAKSNPEMELDGEQTTLWLWKRRNNTSPFHGSIGRFTITNDSLTKFDLVPCIRKADNKPGMYDTVSQTFYTNAGTGEFLYGPEVNGYTTDYEFGVLGKNKCPAATGTEIGQNWEYDQYNHYINISGLQPNCQYTLQCTITKVIPEGSQNRFYLVSRNGSSFINLARSEVPITASVTRYSNDDGTIRIQLNNAFSLDAERAPYLTNIQLELGSTATEYEPYDPNHTVYGGWVDLITGEVAEEWKTIDIGTLTWRSDDSKAHLYTANVPSDSKVNIYNSLCICDTYKFLITTLGTIRTKSDKTIIYGRNGYRGIYLFDDEIEQASDMNTKLSNVILTYSLAVPNTYHLAPTQLQTFLGQNNVWSNADYVEVEYDLHETQDILNRKNFIIANQPHIVRPAAASLQNFKTDMIAPLKECKVRFEPVQDLHGYSNPWPAGGGKNIAKPYDNSYISSTYVSFDYSAANGTFRCYGTASASSTHSSPSATNAVNNGATFTLPAGTYTLSIIDGDGANIYAQCVSSTETVLAETTSYTTFTTNESLTVFVRLKVAAAATVDNTVKIQLEAGSTATSYVPYENICPISGWTGVEVTRCGKNLYNPATVTMNYEIGADGNPLATGSSNNWCITDFIPVKQNTTYITTALLTRGSGRSAIYNANKEKISTKQEVVGANAQTTINVGGDGYYVRLTVRIRDGLNTIFEESSSTTTYEPYSGITLPIDWTDSAGTIYGGYVDLVTGEVVATHYCFTIDSNTTIKSYGIGHNVGRSEYALPYTGANKNAIASNIFGIRSRNSTAWNYPSRGLLSFEPYNASPKSVILGSPNAEDTSKTGWENWLQENGSIQVLYELLEPIHYTLTPTQLKTLRGTNNIWANNNGGNIEVAFWRH